VLTDDERPLVLYGARDNEAMVKPKSKTVSDQTDKP
jgi:hypothetical protein